MPLRKVDALAVCKLQEVTYAKQTGRQTNKRAKLNNKLVCESLVSPRFCVSVCFFRSCWSLFLKQFRGAVSVIFVSFFLPFCTLLCCWLPLLVAIKQASAPHRQKGRNAEGHRSSVQCPICMHRSLVPSLRQSHTGCIPLNLLL